MRSLNIEVSRIGFFERFFEKHLGLGSVSAESERSTGFLYKSLIYFFEGKAYLWDETHAKIYIFSSKQIFDDLNCESIDDIDFKECTLNGLITFEITSFSVTHDHDENVRFLLWGPLGATTAILTSENEGSEATLCAKSRIIGEKSYLEHPDLRILKAKWSPQPKNSHIIILNNDGFLRFYDSKDPRVPLTTLGVGQESSIPFVKEQIESSFPVDFDFGPGLPKSEFLSIFILRSSGAIFLVLARHFPNSTRYIAEIHGPLEEDDLFSEPAIASNCSSILVTKKYPPMLILGFSNGNIQHSILLPKNKNKTNYLTSFNFEERMMVGDIFISNTEVLKLNNENMDTLKDYSMNLILDMNTQNQYICIHSGGVHLISILFMPQLIKYLEDGQMFEPIESEFHNILSWGDSQKSQKNKDRLQLRGCAFINTFPSGRLLALLQDMKAYNYEFSNRNDIEQVNTLLKDSKSKDVEYKAPEYFLSTQLNLKTPIMCSKTEIEGKAMANVLDDIIKKLDGNMNAQDKAMGLLMTTLSNLEGETSIFSKCLQNILDSRIEVQDRSEAISELYELEILIDEQVMKNMTTLQSHFKNAHEVAFEQENKCIDALEKCRSDIETEKMKIRGLSREANMIRNPEINNSDLESGVFNSSKLYELKLLVRRQNASINKMKDVIRALNKSLETFKESS